MALNDNLAFSSADKEVRDAFLEVPQKVLLKAGTRLYKWTDRSLEPGSGVTPWWFFVENTLLPNGRVAEGFRRSEELALRLRQSHRNYARVRAAVSAEFGNTMERLLLTQLLTEVWGFAGKAGGQPEFAREAFDLQHVYLIGGAHQLWIPNLKYPKHLVKIETQS